MRKAKIITPEFRKAEQDFDWVIVCPECEGDAFEILSQSNPIEDDDWEASHVICKNCGACIYNSEDEQ